MSSYEIPEALRVFLTQSLKNFVNLGAWSPSEEQSSPSHFKRRWSSDSAFYHRGALFSLRTFTKFAFKLLAIKSHKHDRQVGGVVYFIALAPHYAEG